MNYIDWFSKVKPTLHSWDNYFIMIYFFKTAVYLFFIFIFSWTQRAGYGILVPWPGIKPVPFASEVWSLNHWITRDIPIMMYYPLYIIIIFDLLTLCLEFLHLCSWGVFFAVSFSCDILGRFCYQGKFGLIDSRSFASSLIFWKSLYRIDIISSLNIW